MSATVTRQWVTAQVSVLVKEGEEADEAQRQLAAAVWLAARDLGYPNEEIA